MNTSSRVARAMTTLAGLFVAVAGMTIIASPAQADEAVRYTSTGESFVVSDVPTLCRANGHPETYNIVDCETTPWQDDMDCLVPLGSETPKVYPSYPGSYHRVACPQDPAHADPRTTGDPRGCMAHMDLSALGGPGAGMWDVVDCPLSIDDPSDCEYGVGEWGYCLSGVPTPPASTRKTYKLELAKKRLNSQTTNRLYVQVRNELFGLTKDVPVSICIETPVADKTCTDMVSDMFGSIEFTVPKGPMTVTAKIAQTDLLEAVTAKRSYRSTTEVVTKKVARRAVTAKVDSAQPRLVKLQVNRGRWITVRQGYTDDNGKIEFTKLPRGTYRAVAPGDTLYYASASHHVRIRPSR